MTLKRQKITAKFSDISIYDLEMSIPNAVELFITAQNDAEAAGYEDIFLDLDYGFGSEGPDGLKVMGTRDETDDELNTRQRKHEKDKEKKAKKLVTDRETYERLAKRFGPNGT